MSHLFGAGFLGQVLKYWAIFDCLLAVSYLSFTKSLTKSPSQSLSQSLLSLVHISALFPSLLSLSPLNLGTKLGLSFSAHNVPLHLACP